MAAMSAADIAKAARIYARQVNGIAISVNHDDIVAAVTALDNAFEGLPTALPNQAQSVALNMNAVLPDPYKSAASTPQKSALLAIWAGVKYGWITSGGN